MELVLLQELTVGMELVLLLHELVLLQELAVGMELVLLQELLLYELTLH